MPEVDPLISIAEAADRLKVSAATVLRYARRYKWRKVKGNDGLLVAVPVEKIDRPRKQLQEQAPPPPPAPPPTPDIAAIVQAATEPLRAAMEQDARDKAALQAALDLSTGDRRTLQQQADALREQLAAVQVERAEVVGVATAEKARREEIEKRAADLQRQLQELRQQAARRRWWWPW